MQDFEIPSYTKMEIPQTTSGAVNDESVIKILLSW